MTSDEKKLEFYESFGSVFWFLMDGAWMLGFAVLAELFIIPTALFNLATFYFIGRSATLIFLQAVALNSWLLMNIFWMVGDIERIEFSLDVAKIFLWIGFGALFAAGYLQKRSFLQAFRYFRRFRIMKS